MTLVRLASLLLPFAYLARTRLRPEPARVIQLLVLEWLPAVLVLSFFTERTTGEAVVAFLWGYAAFITVYEVGYLFNDVLAYRQDDDGRRRLGPAPPGVGAILLALLVRGGLFAAVSLFIPVEVGPQWWSFFGVLALAFTLHNSLTAPGLRGVTFIHLALARFFAPFFAFVSAATQLALAGPVLLNYVLPRLLAYLESKGVLSLEGRARTGFKVRFHLLLLAPSSLLSLVSASWLPLAVNGYYLVWWSLAWVVGFGRERPSARTAAA